jgi:opacity protein-like surface antigen
MRLKLALAILFLNAALPALSQTAPASQGGGGIPIMVGVGFSSFYTDYSAYERGPAFWIDWNIFHGASFLNGIGLEIEGRDLNYLRSGDIPNLREDTIGGGPIYRFRHFHRFNPYGKFLISYGSIDFISDDPFYKHDSRTVYAPGTGLEYRAWRNVWVRGDYEWQFWPEFPHSHALSPDGFTIGASYDFGHIHDR